mmetsp:Transcript_33723/g.54206  ORF Transcript_33723/g.54206 Transcript_33723/m.54206 type:complete len:213 (-) Transcript_33723:198-836(-)
MFPRNLLPRPSPFEAPFTSPAMSTYSIISLTTFAELAIFASASRRASETFALPMLGSMVQKGKFPASAFPWSQRALKSVLLPTFGRPTMPVCKPWRAVLQSLAPEADVDVLLPASAAWEEELEWEGRYNPWTWTFCCFCGLWRLLRTPPRPCRPRPTATAAELSVAAEAAHDASPEVDEVEASATLTSAPARAVLALSLGWSKGLLNAGDAA